MFQTDGKNRKIVLTALFAIAVGVGALSTGVVENIGDQKFQSLENQVNPAGHHINSSDTYRIAEYRGETIYGPYHIENRKYFYHDGDILGPDLKERTSKDARRLHSFYMENYFDPIFYSPTSNRNQSDLSGFEKYEEDKVLTERCGLEYDTIPSGYLESLGNNMRTTDSFFSHASVENAEALINSNRRTLNGYLDYISSFTTNLNLNLSQNECFTDSISQEGVSLVTRTPSSSKINRQTLADYASMANQNALMLDREISSREALLDNSTGFEIERYNHSFVNRSYSYDVFMNQSEAFMDFNDRRRNEVVELDETQEGAITPDDGTGEEESTGQDQPDLNLSEEQKEEVRLLEKDPRGYEIDTYCTINDTDFVYGEQMNIYPNIISGVEKRYKNNEPYLKDFYTACRCPYVEISRLNWYVVDEFNKYLDSESYSGPSADKVEAAERNFRNYPGQDSMRQVSDSYDEAVRESLRNGEINRELPEMWRMSRQQESKLHKFRSAYDDFYNDYHMEVWKDYFPLEGDRNYSAAQYYYFFLMGSEYPMHFMTWSDSVWRIDEQPEMFSGTVRDSGR